MSNLEFRLTLILIGLAFVFFAIAILEGLYGGRLENAFICAMLGVSTVIGLWIFKLVNWIIKWYNKSKEVSMK